MNTMRLVSKPLLACAALCFGSIQLAAGAACDVNDDGAIDRADVTAITLARNSIATMPVDDRDADGDHQITVLDARICATRCSLPNCAVAGLPPSSAVIGVGGGAVGLPDGARIDIPPGALGGATTISIKEIPLPVGAALPTGARLAGKIYELGPTGQTFQIPVRLTVPLVTPAGFAAGDGSIYRIESDGSLHMVGDASQDPIEAESAGQAFDPATGRLSVHLSGFSAYGAIAVKHAANFADVVLASANGTATVTVRRPATGGLRATKPGYNAATHKVNCATQLNLVTRATTGNSVQAIVIHSTNSTNSGRTIDGELGWATDNCNLFLAHYYIDKDGLIYQVADDGSVTNHIGDGSNTGAQPSLGIVNGNAVGIELLNNVGEPYDGRQITSLVRLADYLSEAHGLARPVRDPATGLYARNRQSIANGGERVITHNDYNGKCDPVGFLRSVGRYFPLTAAQGCATPSQTIAGADPNAPALLDAVYDALGMLDRDRQHTGVVNTSGGDSYGTEAPGDGGNVRFRVDRTVVGNAVGLVVPLSSTANAPLIVGPGTPRSNLSGTQTFSDVIIAGTLEVTGNLELRLVGTFYLAPGGRIVLRQNGNGGRLTVYSRGTPIIQGLIDARGEDGAAANGVGGAGGAVDFLLAAPGPLLVPTVISRGGDSDVANPTPPAGGTHGGRGGNVTIETADSPLFVGGGVGLRINDLDLPPIRSGTIPITLPLAPRHVGDFLPPPPPFTLTSLGVTRPVADQRVPLVKSFLQPGFSRGLLTTGGMGGAGSGGAGALNGGAGGDGGNITFTLTPNARVAFRDADLITGAEVETVVYRFFLPESGLAENIVFPVSGSLGGVGTGTGATRGGDGGPGGKAGNILRTGGSIVPAPARFADLYPVRGFVAGLRLHDSDSGATGNTALGSVKEATSATGQKLYRLRISTSGALIGGLGGIAGGKAVAGQFPGAIGAQGAGGSLGGLPFQ